MSTSEDITMTNAPEEIDLVTPRSVKTERAPSDSGAPSPRAAPTETGESSESEDEEITAIRQAAERLPAPSEEKNSAYPVDLSESGSDGESDSRSVVSSRPSAVPRLNLPTAQSDDCSVDYDSARSKSSQASYSSVITESSVASGASRGGRRPNVPASSATRDPINLVSNLGDMSSVPEESTDQIDQANIRHTAAEEAATKKEDDSGPVAPQHGPDVPAPGPVALQHGPDVPALGPVALQHGPDVAVPTAPEPPLRVEIEAEIKDEKVDVVMDKAKPADNETPLRNPMWDKWIGVAEANFFVS